MCLGQRTFQNSGLTMGLLKLYNALHQSQKQLALKSFTREKTPLPARLHNTPLHREGFNDQEGVWWKKTSGRNCRSRRLAGLFKGVPDERGIPVNCVDKFAIGYGEKQT